MLARMLRSVALVTCIAGGAGGCLLSQSGSSTTLPSSAFFSIEPDQLGALQEIGHAQDLLMKQCHKGATCEEAYYIRGLVALFENRANAISVFQELHTVMPNSRYDSATTGWLNLLQDRASSSSESKAVLGQLKQQVLLKLLEHRGGIVAQGTEAQNRRIAELNE